MTMSNGRKTAIAIVVLAAVAAGAVIALIQLVGGDDADQADAKSQSSGAKATTTTRAPPPTTRAPFNYQVQPGDTLTSIAQQFGVSTLAIVAANQLTNPDRLTEGATLVIPSAPPLQLVITPPTTEAGLTVELKLTGAKPSERVTFEINKPNGVFTGPPHTASPEGSVMTTYTPGLGDPEGTYTVIARGDEGTTAQATLQVEPEEF